MENVVLYYNAAAGSFRMGNEKLMEVLKDYGYNIVASSPIEKDMELVNPPDYSMIIIAGGDGTVKRICLLLMAQNVRDKKIAILPFGTANNISLHFENNLDLSPDQICQKWAGEEPRFLDIGQLRYGGKDSFFVESFGFGLFPSLIKTMEKMKRTTSSTLSPSQELKEAIKKLYKSMFESKGTRYRIEYDGNITEGYFLLVEIMNIKSLGPRWRIAPMASAEDGHLDIVIIPSNKKKQLIDYMKSLFKNIDTMFPFQSIRARDLTVTVFEKSYIYHIDDTVMQSNAMNVFQLSVLPSHFKLIT